MCRDVPDVAFPSVGVFTHGPETHFAVQKAIVGDRNERERRDVIEWRLENGATAVSESLLPRKHGIEWRYLFSSI